MNTFILTAFDKKGKKLMDESFTAPNDDEAKEKAELMLYEKGFHNNSYRCVASDARLVLFNS